MARVRLTYFRQSGRCCGDGSYDTAQPTLQHVWSEVQQKRRVGHLPGLRLGQGRECVILIELEDHTPHLDMPARLDDEDVTPIEVPILKLKPDGGDPTS